MSEVKKHVYKNVSGMDQELIGHGMVKAGALVETSDILNNGNFVEAKEEPAQQKPTPEKGAKKDTK